MTYTEQTWSDWTGDPAAAPTESKFTAERGNHIEAGIAAAHDDLAGTTTGEPGKLLRLDDVGRAAAADASDDTQLATLGQVKSEVENGVGTLVRPAHVYLGSQPSYSTTTPGDLPDLVLGGLKTGDKRRVNVLLKYRGASGSGAGGLLVVFKGGVVAVTNKLDSLNPSFETDTAHWSATSLTTLSRATAGGAQDGSAYLKAVIGGAATSQQIWSEWVPVTPGQELSGAMYARRVSAIARTFRTSYQFKDAAGNLLTTTFGGSDTTPGTGSWTRAIVDDTHGGLVTAPSTAVYARLRGLLLNVAAGDEFHFDAAQMEFTRTITAYGSTGGSGTSVLDIDGAWHGLKLAGSSKEDYTRIESVRTAAVADTTAKFGAIGTSEDTTLTGTFDVTVLGDGLTDQQIALQVAQQASSGTATQIMSGNATFAVLS